MKPRRSKNTNRLPCGCIIRNGTDLAPCDAHRAEDLRRLADYEARHRQALADHASHMEQKDEAYIRRIAREA